MIGRAQAPRTVRQLLPSSRSTQHVSATPHGTSHVLPGTSAANRSSTATARGTSPLPPERATFPGPRARRGDLRAKLRTERADPRMQSASLLRSGANNRSVRGSFRVLSSTFLPLSGSLPELGANPRSERGSFRVSSSTFLPLSCSLPEIGANHRSERGSFRGLPSTFLPLWCSLPELGANNRSERGSFRALSSTFRSFSRDPRRERSSFVVVSRSNPPAPRSFGDLVPIHRGEHHPFPGCSGPHPRLRATFRSIGATLATLDRSFARTRRQLGPKVAPLASIVRRPRGLVSTHTMVESTFAEVVANLAASVIRPDRARRTLVRFAARLTAVGPHVTGSACSAPAVRCSCASVWPSPGAAGAPGSTLRPPRTQAFRHRVAIRGRTPAC